MSGHLDNGMAARVSTAPAGAGGMGDGDGLPHWATALRQDVRTLSKDIKELGRDFRADVKDLGKEFRDGLRYQTWALVGLAMMALVLNSALILGSLYVRATTAGVTVSTSSAPASPVSPDAL
jgi:hypothetical protein